MSTLVGTDNRLLWVFRALPTNWREGSLDAALDAWESGKRDDPWRIWWGKGKGSAADVRIGAPALLYQADAPGTPLRKCTRGFRALATIASTIVPTDSPSGWGLDVVVQMRFSRVVPYQVVADDLLLSQHMFCRYASATQYAFVGEDLQRLVLVIGKHLPRDEANELRESIGSHA